MAKTQLEMIFRDDLGKEVTLNLVNPKADLTLATVKAAMQAAIDKNIFSNKGASLKEIVKAEIRTVDVVALA